MEANSDKVAMSTETNSRKKWIMRWMEDPKMVDFIYETVDLVRNNGKGNMVEFCFGNTNGVDFAVPLSWANTCRDMSIDPGDYVFSYKKEHGGFGTPLNVYKEVFKTLVDRRKALKEEFEQSKINHSDQRNETKQ